VVVASLSIPLIPVDRRHFVSLIGENVRFEISYVKAF
jgi:hypothetical protein